MGDTAYSSKRPARFRLGVREKMALILLATLLITLSVTSLLSLRAQKQDILEEINRRGSESVQFIAQSLANSVVSYDYHTLELLLQDLVRGHDIIYARVDNNRGNVMAVAGTPASTYEAVQQFSAPIHLNGDDLAQLHLTLSTERIQQTLVTRQRESLFRQMLAILAVMLVGFVGLSILIVRPLGKIAQAISQNLDEGSAKLRAIPFESRDEFGDLVLSYNALQARLEDARQKLESRIDHANLELRKAYDQLTVQANDLREINQELEQLSITDPLTNLYNRRYFSQIMENEVAMSIRNDETISIILLDIDHFKSINLRYGYNGGDVIIRDVARIISERTRNTDVACRYGGDEFFILCRRSTIANAVSIADGLYSSLAGKIFRVDGQEVRVTVSIGVATIPGVKNISTASEFFQCADDALRHCKKQGRNGVVHYSMLDRAHHANAL